MALTKDRESSKRQKEFSLELTRRVLEASTAMEDERCRRNPSHRCHRRREEPIGEGEVIAAGSVREVVAADL